jgi:hypothetical protein
LSRDRLPPGADGCCVFRFFRSSAVGSRRRVLTSFRDAGAVGGWRHHTRLEALSPGRWRVQRALRIMLCGLDTSLYPHTVRCNAVAAQRAGASESQVRGRGSTRVPSATLAASHRAEADVQSTRRAQGHRPMCSSAFATYDVRHPRAPSRGSSHDRPVRRWAHPLRSSTLEETCAYRLPFAVAACRTRHGPTDGLRRLRLCPCGLVSPIGRGSSDPQGCPGGTRPPLRRRPT